MASRQLMISRDLSFRSSQVDVAIQGLDRAKQKLEKRFQPRFVFLSSGHMIDEPGRKEPRFPADMEKIALQAISSKLDELGAGQKDLALCGGACGGNLLFAESKSNTTLYVQPDELRSTPIGVDVFNRNNLWQLYTTLSWTSERVHFISLWNGR